MDRDSIKAGMYAWGGPGTIRLLRTKYHSPSIDKQSFLTLYDFDRLKKAKEIFGLSDVWVTFSWGFSKATEEEDYRFIAQRMDNFKRLNLRTHAYVQGLNVVEKECEEDVYCRDLFGRVIPYSKGRKLMCPNNPRATDILSRRVDSALHYDFDGVYIDNMLFGFPPAFIRSDFAPFFGCFCHFCQTNFLQQYKYPLSFPITSRNRLIDYLDFRKHTMKTLIDTIGELVHSKGKYFGINLFDPVQMTPEIYFGYNSRDIEKVVDYLLIENHSLPSRGHTNEHLRKLCSKTTKPVFVLSYDRGIGFEPEYTQNDFDTIASEAKQIGYLPCYKVSEFTTKGIWHTEDFSTLHTVSTSIQLHIGKDIRTLKLSPRRWGDRVFADVVNRALILLVTEYFENPLLSAMGRSLYRRKLHSWKNYEI